MLRVWKYAGLCDVDWRHRARLYNCGDGLYTMKEREGCHVVCAGWVGSERVNRVEIINSYAEVVNVARLCDIVFIIWHAHVACWNAAVIQLALLDFCGHAEKLTKCQQCWNLYFSVVKLVVGANAGDVM